MSFFRCCKIMASHRTGRWDEVFLKEFRGAGLTERETNYPATYIHTRIKDDLTRNSMREKVIPMRLYEICYFKSQTVGISQSWTFKWM